MDQIKIGAFIAQTRKKQGMTQKKLADALNISNKTVSKWECGKGMPDYALMLPLCNILGITVNELLSGEHLSDTDYTDKAEENMMQLLLTSEEAKRKRKRSMIADIIGEFMIVLCVISIFQLSTNFNLVFFFDFPTFLAIFGIIMLEMIVTKSLKPFLHSFRIILQKKEAGKEELVTSLQAVRLFLLSAVLAGAIFFVISLIAIFMDGQSSVTGVNFAITLFVLFDSLFLLLLMLPVKYRLEIMLVIQEQ